MSFDWTDLEAYIGLPRLQGLVLSPDAETLLVSTSGLNADRTGYVSAWWRLDPHGLKPASRYTRSVEGESAAAFSPNGSLLFTSARPAPTTSPAEQGDASSTETDPNVIWCLPAGGGEAYPLARRDGGWEGIAIARSADVALLSARYHVGTTNEAEDRAKRAARKKRKINAILHEGYPVRFWDHDLNETDTRLFTADLTDLTDPSFGGPDTSGSDNTGGTDELTDITPGPIRGISGVEAVAADGSFAVITQQQAGRAGWVSERLVEIDLGTGEQTVLAAEPGYSFGGAVLSDDGRLIVCRRESDSTPTTAPRTQLWLIERDTGVGRVLAPDWDRWPSPVAFDPDATSLYVIADDEQQAPIFAVDLGTGEVQRLTADGDGAYSQVRRSPDGETLFALRSSYLDPGSVVAISTADGSVSVLPGRWTIPSCPVTWSRWRRPPRTVSGSGACWCVPVARPRRNRPRWRSGSTVALSAPGTPGPGAGARG